jgi:Na+/glutamate symporter
MTSNPVKHPVAHTKATWPVFWAVTVTFLLFCIDEGAYNLDWMSSPVNYVFFGVYVIGLLMGQIIINLVVLMKYRGSRKTLITCLAGIPLGLFLTIGMFLSLQH